MFFFLSVLDLHKIMQNKLKSELGEAEYYDGKNLIEGPKAKKQKLSHKSLPLSNLTHKILNKEEYKNIRQNNDQVDRSIELDQFESQISNDKSEEIQNNYGINKQHENGGHVENRNTINDQIENQIKDNIEINMQDKEMEENQMQNMDNEQFPNQDIEQNRTNCDTNERFQIKDIEQNTTKCDTNEQFQIKSKYKQEINTRKVDANDRIEVQNNADHEAVKRVEDDVRIEDRYLPSSIQLGKVFVGR